MFKLISNQIPEIAGKSWDDVDPSAKSNERRNNRLAAVDELIELLGRQPLNYLLPNVNTFMLGDPFDLIPRAGGRSILIPALCLLDKEELPAHLRIADPLDPRLQDPEWFNQFGQWLKEHLGCESKNPNFLEKELFRFYIKFVQNPNKAAKAIRFILGHELGHIVYRHCGEELLPKRVSLISAAVFGMVVGFSLSFQEDTLPTSIGKTCLGALASLTGFLALRTLRLLQESRQREKQADLFSFKICSTASEGAIYLFDTLKKHYQEVKRNIPSTLNWREYLVNHLTIRADGELRVFNWTHSSFQERIERAKDFLSQQPSKPMSFIFVKT